METLWIARDEDGSLYLYWQKPELDKKENEPGSFFVPLDIPNKSMKLVDGMYPEVTFENSPQRLISHQSIWQVSPNGGSCLLNPEVVMGSIPKGCSPRYVTLRH